MICSVLYVRRCSPDMHSDSPPLIYLRLPILSTLTRIRLLWSLLLRYGCNGWSWHHAFWSTVGWCTCIRIVYYVLLGQFWKIWKKLSPSCRQIVTWANLCGVWILCRLVQAAYITSPCKLLRVASEARALSKTTIRLLCNEILCDIPVTGTVE